MARYLSLLAVSALLCGCAAFEPSTEDFLHMQDQALRAYETGDDAKAEALYLGLLKQTPNDAEALLRLGNLYARSDRPDKAAETYMRALLLNPNDERLWYNLGVVRQRQAHAAFIQTFQMTGNADPLHEKSAAMVRQLAPQDDKQAETHAQQPDK